VKYGFIRTHGYLFPIEKMCSVLGVGTSGYFKWKSRAKSSRLLLKEKIKGEISSIYFASKQRYGSPRITFELLARGYKVSRPTVAKYMGELGLRSRLGKKFKATTNSKHNYLVVGNVLGRDFSATGPSKAWVSDITYIRTAEGFLYLTTVIDLYDRKVVGWSLASGWCREDEPCGVEDGRKGEKV